MTQKIGMNSSEITANAADGPEWVKDMHAHFARTGVYRPEHLQRLLGHPVEGISAPTSPPPDSEKPQEKK
jgi:hypothetical protein